MQKPVIVRHPVTTVAAAPESSNSSITLSEVLQSGLDGEQQLSVVATSLSSR